MTSPEYLRRCRMKNKFFSKDLFIEGLRRNRTLSLVIMFIGMIASFLSVLSYHYQGNRTYYLDDMTYGYSSSSSMAIQSVKPITEAFYTLNPFIFVMMVIAPFMVITVLGFLNKRSSCDFYHSLSYSRQCMYLSFIASVICWQIMIILGASLVTVVGAYFIPEISVEEGTVIFSILSAIASTLLSTAASALAMTVTGTVFTNLLATLMILFAPRAFATFFKYALIESIPYVADDVTGVFFEFKYNTMFATIVSLFDSYTFKDSLSALPVVYTTAVAIFVCIVGLFMFVVRKSEDAQKASVNKYFQAVFRLIPALLISLAPIYLIFENWKDSKSAFANSFDEEFFVIVLYVIVTITYFLYELITTRKPKNMLKALPVFILVPVINIAMFFGLTIGYERIANECPEPETVVSINMGKRYSDVIWDQLSKIDIDDSRIIEVLCKDLGNTISITKENESQFYRRQGNAYHVTFNLGSKSISRYVIIERGDMEAITRYLAENSQLEEAVGEIDTMIAELAQSSTNESENYYYYFSDVNKEHSKECFDVFAEEYASLSLQDKLMLFGWDGDYQDDKYRYYVNDFDLFYVYFCDRGSTYGYMNIGITKALPKTVAKIMNVTNEINGNCIEEFIKQCQSALSDEDYFDVAYIDAAISVSAVGPVYSDGEFVGYTYKDSSFISLCGSDNSNISLPDEESVERIKELYEKKITSGAISPEDISSGKSYLRISYNYTLEDYSADEVDYGYYGTKYISDGAAFNNYYLVDDASEIISVLNKTTYNYIDFN